MISIICVWPFVWPKMWVSKWIFPLHEVWGPRGNYAKSVGWFLIQLAWFPSYADRAMSCEGWRSLCSNLMYTFLWVFRFLCVASLGSNYRWTAARILQFRFQLPIEALNAGECNSLVFNFFIPCPKLIKQKDKIPTMTARTWACVCL